MNTVVVSQRKAALGGAKVAQGFKMTRVCNAVQARLAPGFEEVSGDRD